MKARFLALVGMELGCDLNLPAFFALERRWLVAPHAPFVERLSVPEIHVVFQILLTPGTLFLVFFPLLGALPVAVFFLTGLAVGRQAVGIGCHTDEIIRRLDVFTCKTLFVRTVPPAETLFTDTVRGVRKEKLGEFVLAALRAQAFPRFDICSFELVDPFVLELVTTVLTLISPSVFFALVRDKLFLVFDLEAARTLFHIFDIVLFFVTLDAVIQIRPGKSVRTEKHPMMEDTAAGRAFFLVLVDRPRSQCWRHVWLIRLRVRRRLQIR